MFDSFVSCLTSHAVCVKESQPIGRGDVNGGVNCFATLICKREQIVVAVGSGTGLVHFVSVKDAFEYEGGDAGDGDDNDGDGDRDDQGGDDNNDGDNDAGDAGDGDDAHDDDGEDDGGLTDNYRQHDVAETDNVEV